MGSIIIGKIGDGFIFFLMSCLVRNSLYAILSVLLLYFVLIITSCGDRQPSLSSAQMQWKMYNRNVDTDDPNYPLEVIEDGYKMIRAYRTKAMTIKGTKIPATNEVEWGWKFTVKNKSKKDFNVTVEYILKDKDLFKVASDTKYSQYVKTGKIVTIQSTSTMSYERAKRVVGNGWEISYYER